MPLNPKSRTRSASRGATGSRGTASAHVSSRGVASAVSTARDATAAAAAATADAATIAREAYPIRPLQPGDFDEVLRIDALHTGAGKPEYWREVFAAFVGVGAGSRARVRRTGTPGAHLRIGLAAPAEASGLRGYLFGEVRAFEYGSEPCGWIFGVGVDPAHLRGGVARALLDEALRRFRAEGVGRVRTMVHRSDVPVLSFFRSSGFVGGPFVQLEHELLGGDTAVTP